MQFFPSSPFRLPKRRELIAPITTSIKLENQLLSPGENLRVQIVCLQEKRPPERIIIFNHYLKFVYKNQTEVSLKWEKREKTWEAFFEFLPQSVGSYLLKFSNGTRDPINPYMRYFAVIDEKSTILSFRHCLDIPMANYGNLYHRHFLPADYELPLNPAFNKILINPNWIGHLIYRYYQNKYGDDIYPLLSLQTLTQPKFATTETNLSNTDELARVLSRIQDFWENDLHYQRPQIMSFDIFLPHLSAAAISSKILALTGLFPDLQIYDENLKNNLKGMPLFPYYININELRASDLQKSSLVGIPITSHPLFSYEYGAYQLSPAIAQRNGYASGENMESLFDYLDNLIRNRDQRTPNFLTIDFQDNHVSEVIRMNSRIFHRIIKYARRDQLVFAHKLEVAKYFLRKFLTTPEKAFFLQDTFLNEKALTTTGFISDIKQKTSTINDVIYFENNEYRFCFRRNELTPYYFYQYGSPLNIDLNITLPEKNISRQKVVLFRIHETTIRFVIKVQTEESDPFFPVALWSLPATLEDIQFSSKHNFTQFIAVHDRLQRELHAIAILSIVPGLNEFYLDLGVRPKRENLS